MNKLDGYEIAAQNLSCSGYGLSKDELKQILLKLTPQELDNLMYSCNRTADKIGYIAFDETELCAQAVFLTSPENA